MTTHSCLPGPRFSRQQALAEVVLASTQGQMHTMRWEQSQQKQLLVQVVCGNAKLCLLVLSSRLLNAVCVCHLNLRVLLALRAIVMPLTGVPISATTMHPDMHQHPTCCGC